MDDAVVCGFVGRRQVVKSALTLQMHERFACSANKHIDVFQYQYAHHVSIDTEETPGYGTHDTRVCCTQIKCPRHGVRSLVVRPL